MWWQDKGLTNKVLYGNVIYLKATFKLCYRVNKDSDHFFLQNLYLKYTCPSKIDVEIMTMRYSKSQSIFRIVKEQLYLWYTFSIFVLSLARVSEQLNSTSIYCYIWGIIWSVRTIKTKWKIVPALNVLKF